ncbi:hypothetical protein [Corynebacterium glyciniphilum]|uniref:Putative membrane protein n=1 Tax=Corynebacterium glyciniphilum AJ 3170 TaxID=1404245 RepID=X5DR55_9CORY|nr:hypothetical protein [Corynebacterium glyciniphilum]AHW63749.1 Putative membrane protein [Corynebacterium glyciniphilum AJ 3170]
MYLLITVIASLLVGLILVYLVLAVFDREPKVPGRTRRERRAVRPDEGDGEYEEQQERAQ